MFQVTTLPSGSRPGKPTDRSITPRIFSETDESHRQRQLEAECYALAFQKVYTFGPHFPGGKLQHRPHAAELWMIEPEIAFADLSDDMDLAERMVRHVIAHVLKTCRRK
jgi:asparaginyl-tRNA synthetase